MALTTGFAGCVSRLWLCGVVKRNIETFGSGPRAMLGHA
jgi:hypothetical protein